MTEEAVRKALFFVAAFAYTDLAAITEQTAQEERHFIDSRWFDRSAQSGSILDSQCRPMFGVSSFLSTERLEIWPQWCQKLLPEQWSTFPLRVW